MKRFMEHDLTSQPDVWWRREQMHISPQSLSISASLSSYIFKQERTQRQVKDEVIGLDVKDTHR